jgi:hypothetical protein
MGFIKYKKETSPFRKQCHYCGGQIGKNEEHHKYIGFDDYLKDDFTGARYHSGLCFAETQKLDLELMGA